MIKIYSPRDDGELAIAKSILDSEDIKYYVKNDHFGSLYAGTAIGYFNEKTIYVPEEFAEKALDLLDLLINPEKNTDQEK